MTQLPQTMRAAQWTSIESGIENNLVFTAEARLPKKANSLSAGQTLVKVAYAAINPVDYKFAENPVTRRLLSNPAIPGIDFAGTVVSTKNKSLKEGDQVFGRTEPPAFGCLGEYLVAGTGYLNKVPDGVSLKDASTAGVAALAAYQSIAPYCKPGSEVFINGGSGGTGIFCIQFAKALGARVTTTCSGGNIEMVKALGADVVINYKEVNLVKHLKDSGKYYDLFVDNVWSDRNLFWQCHFYTEPGAFYVTPGDTNLGAVKDLGLAYIWPGVLGGGQRRFDFVRAEPGEKAREQIGKWFQDGTVKAVIEQEFTLEDAAKAYAKLKTGRTKGKIVVKVS